MEEVICRADYKFEAEMNGMQGVLLGISFGVFLSLIFFMFSDLKSLSPHKIKDFSKLKMVNEEHRNDRDGLITTSSLPKEETEMTKITGPTTVRCASGSSAMDQDQFIRLMEAIQHERKVTLGRACRSLHKSPRDCSDGKEHIQARAFYSTTYNYSVCNIQKCGFSNWLRAVLIQDGFYTADDYQTGRIFGDDVINFAKAKRGFASIANMNKRREMWKNSLKIIQVRNPFERLVSAYNDKMVPNDGKLSPYYGPISRQINRSYKHLRHNESDRMKNDTTASFEDFIHHLISPKQKDSHWAFYHEWCQPCYADYDYIIKFETLYEDIEYLKIKLNISKEHQKTFFPMEITRTNDDKVKTHFSQIQKELALRLYNHYRGDFMLFGYEMPYWLC